MRYEVVSAHDQNCYATGLSYARHMLKWESASGCDTLVVEVPFGDDVMTRTKEEVCPALGACEPVAGRYLEVVPHVFVRYVTAQEKVREGGCPLRSAAKTYAIFAVRRDGDRVFLHASNSDGLIQPICSVPLELHVEVSRVTQLERVFFFKTRVVETDYWCLSFPSEMGEDVRDGDLAYQVDGLQIPLTTRMFVRGEAYVKSSSKPALVALSKGIVLT